MELKTEVVTFRDGSSLTLCEENWDIGMMLEELERLAKEGEPLPDPKAQLFRVMFYPKLAACVIGQVPTEEEARAMPSSELDKWYAAVKRLNPKWFQVLDQLSEEAQAAQIKKNRKKQRK